MGTYQIVTGKNFDDLAFAVSAEMRRGWVPQGGVSHTGPTYAQAMIKLSSED